MPDKKARLAPLPALGALIALTKFVVNEG